MVAIALAALLTVPLALGQARLPEVERIGDQGGSFNVPVPPRWHGEVDGTLVRLTPPDGSGSVTVAVLADGHIEHPGDASAEEVLERLWELVGMDTMPPLAQTTEGASRSGVERTIVARFDADSDWVTFATVEQVDRSLYVVVVDLALETLQRRSAEVARIGSGLRIAAIERDEAAVRDMRPVEEVVPELEAFVTRWLEPAVVPGVGIAIVHEGETVYRGAFGVRSTASGEPFVVDDRVMIGSVGKALTTALIGVLVDDGLLNWDAPVVDVLPGFALQDAEATAMTTMRHLACACIGVPRRDVETFFRAHERDAADVIASLASFEFSTGFGETFQYSNELMAAAGYAAAAATGSDPDALGRGYAELLHDRLLVPLGMMHTTLDGAAVTAAGRHAVPHSYDIVSDSMVPIDPALERMLDPIAPAGAHWSTLDDLARFAIALMPGPAAAPPLLAGSILETWTPHVALTDTLSYGLGWFVEQSAGRLVVHHAGNTLGFTTEVALVPASSLGVIVVANGVYANDLTVGIRDRLFELVFDREPRTERTLESAVDRREAALAEVRAGLGGSVVPSEVQAFLGRYEHERAGEVSLVHDGSELLLQGETFVTRLVPVDLPSGDGTAFLMRDPPMILTALGLGGDASGRTLEFGAGIDTYRFTRVGEP